MAFLGIGKKKQERRAAAAQSTIEQIIGMGGTLTEYDKMNMIYASDGKIDTKEKKLLKKYTKQNERTDRVVERQEEKTERVELKQEAKTERVDIRAAARAIAYQNGINPLGDAIGHVTKAAATIIPALAGGGGGGLFGGGNNDFPIQIPEINLPSLGVEDSGNKMLLYAGLAIALMFILFKGKGRR